MEGNHRRRRFMSALFTVLFVLVACSPGCSPRHRGALPEEILRGVTVDSVDELDRTLAALDALSFAPAIRLVLDVDGEPQQYRRAVSELSKKGVLMAELVDSGDLASVPVADARSRAAAFVEAFGADVDIWEVGNEINGEWAGASPDEILAKVQAMADEVDSRGGLVALTFNYWSSSRCYSSSWEGLGEFLGHVGPRLASQVDVAFVSAYEGVCDPPQKADARAVANALEQLARAFPTAKVGVGEIGALRPEDGAVREPTRGEKEAVMRRWIGLHDEICSIVGPRFVGGWFWWYFVEDVADVDAESIAPALDEALSAVSPCRDSR